MNEKDELELELDRDDVEGERDGESVCRYVASVLSDRVLMGLHITLVNVMLEVLHPLLTSYIHAALLLCSNAGV